MASSSGLATLPDAPRPAPATLDDLDTANLADRTLPLPRAALHRYRPATSRIPLGHHTRPDGRVDRFMPGIVLVRFHHQAGTHVLEVEPSSEAEAVDRLLRRSDLAFAELNVLLDRQFAPNDPLFADQWHHQIVGNPAAWDLGLGNATVQIAIVDTPFQMNHPDLAANTTTGWSVISDSPVTASPGIDHSTAGAGMAAAVINNRLGVAGAANCTLLPIDVTGFVDEMHAAIVWAAEHGVRVVNLSWSGGDSAVIEEAAQYLATRSRGVVVMSGVNGSGFLAYTNQPHIYCVSMTDAADNLQSRFGDHIDFAAPGWDVWTTVTGSGYAPVRGTSFSAPLFSGAVAALFSINPSLSPEEVIGLLRDTSDDLGPAGQDPYFGWGRIHLGRAAAAAHATLPRIDSIQALTGAVRVSLAWRPGVIFHLWQTPRLTPPQWQLVENASVSTNHATITLTDPAPPSTSIFYQVSTEADLSGAN